MTFTFDATIPAAPNNPSNDQPIMLNNNIATNGILQVDHIGFGVANGGTHKYSTYTKVAIGDNIPGAVSNPTSVAYAGAGVVDTTHPQYYFKNSNNTFLLNCIKAFGSYIAASGSTTFINNSNCTMTTNVAGTVATITLTTGATSGTSFIVIPFVTNNQSVTYAITGANTFTITVNAGGVGQTVSFIVLQS